MEDTKFEPRDDECFFSWENSDGETVHSCIEETILAKLLVDGVMFVGNFDSGPFFETKASSKDITTCVYVNCNDLFYWACADAEPITTEELPELYRMHKADPKWGSWKWCCKKRKMKPQVPIVNDMKKEGLWEDWMDDLETPSPS